MSKKSEDNPKKPYMYIVQPDISPPDPDMQSQFRSIIGEDDIKVVEVEESSVVEEIRIISSESVDEIEEKLTEVPISQDEGLVVEMSTAVTVNEDEKVGENAKKVKDIVRKKNKKKSFSEMTKEELIHFLARMPAAVPKPMCIITIEGEKFRGQFEKQKGEYFLLRLEAQEGSELIQVRLEDIEAVEVENL